MATVTCEVQWLLYLMSDLLIFHTQVIPLHFDSKNALHLLAMQCFIIGQNIQTKIIRILYI